MPETSASSSNPASSHAQTSGPSKRRSRDEQAPERTSTKRRKPGRAETLANEQDDFQAGLWNIVQDTVSAFQTNCRNYIFNQSQNPACSDKCVGEREALEKSVSDLQDKVNTLNSENLGLSASYDEAKKNLKQLTSEKSSLEKRLKVVEKEAAQREDALRRKLQLAEESITQREAIYAKSIIEESEAQTAKARSEYERALQEVLALREQEKSTLQQSLSQLQKDNQISREKIVTLQSECANYRERMQKLQEENFQRHVSEFDSLLSKFTR